MFSNLLEFKDVVETSEMYKLHWTYTYLHSTYGTEVYYTAAHVTVILDLWIHFDTVLKNILYHDCMYSTVDLHSKTFWVKCFGSLSHTIILVRAGLCDSVRHSAGKVERRNEVKGYWCIHHSFYRCSSGEKFYIYVYHVYVILFIQYILQPSHNNHTVFVPQHKHC